MSITFSPKSNGNTQGAVTIIDTTVVRQQEVALSGTGTGGGTAPLTFSPTTLTFAAQAFNAVSTAQVVAITNASSTSLTISGIATSGNYSATASGAIPCKANTTLPSHSACTLSVTFTPTYLGVIKGAVVVSDNASIGQQVLNVSGTGVLPVKFSPASVTFGAQSVGTTSAPQTLALTNNQSTTLSKLSIAASGDYAVSTNNCAVTLTAHATCTFSITFTPSQTGTVLGGVTVNDSALGNPQVVNLSGTGQ
jgi:hypothetical protein